MEQKPLLPLSRGERSSEETGACTGRADPFPVLPDVVQGIVLFDPANGRILQSSGTILKTLGYSHEEMRQLTLSDLEAGDKPLRTAEHLATLRRQGFVRFHTRHQAPGGDLLPASLSCQIIQRQRKILGSATIHYGAGTDPDIGLLGRIVHDLSSLTGRSFFHALGEKLCTLLDADYIAIGKLAEKPKGGTLKTLCFCNRQRQLENIEYELAGTPCEKVLQGRLCSFPHGLTSLFPGDELLADLGIEAYAGTPLLDSQGVPAGLMCALFRSPLGDPTATEALLSLVGLRASAELERLRAQEKLLMYEQLVNHAADPLALVNADYTYRLVNRSYLEAFARDGHQIVGSTPEQIFGPERFNGQIRPALDLCLQGKKTSCRVTAVDPPGKRRYFDCRLAPLTNEQDSVTAVVVSCRDITAQELAAQNRKLRVEVLEAMADAQPLSEVLTLLARLIEENNPSMLCSVLLVNKNRRTLQVAAAPSLPDFYNCAVDGIPLGKGMGSCGTAAFLGQRVVTTDISTHPYWREYRHIALQAGLRTCWSEPIVSPEGTVLGTFAIYYKEPRQPDPNDLALIDELATLAAIAIGRQQTEEKRSELEAQLRQAQKMEAVGQLAGGIAHDFNNILGSILGFARLGRQQCGNGRNPRATRYLNEILLAANRAEELVGQLLTLSRKRPMKRERVGLRDLLSETLALLKPTLPRGISLQISLAPEEALIQADRTQVQQMILNLCINSRDALGGSGVIGLVLNRTEAREGHCDACHGRFSGRYTTLTVTDSGPGIPTEARSRLFEPFFTTKKIGRGTGLGLSIVHGIVHDHGGHIQVGGDSNQGASFEIFLPAAREEA